jgi:beta-phosphoglucomutase
MQPKCFIFDFDGVLCESQESHKNTLINALNKFNYQWCEKKEAIYEALKDVKTISKLRAMTRQTLVNVKDIEHICALKQTMMKTEVASLKMHPLVIEHLTFLKKMNKVAIASDSNSSTILEFLRHNHVLELFDVISTSDDVGLTKPAPDVYMLVLKRLNAQAAHSIAFEDTQDGVVAARLSRVSSVHTCTYVTLPNVLLQYTQGS